ncbi:MAG: hypothetical protein NDJ24_09185 [Alphaproteobacteria bacterium]|nr:hypothetical protein [Alphaproteobacteria bacterium]
MDFKSINWNAAIKKLTGPQSSHDLNVFLENLPQTAGHTVLIAAGIAWASAAAAGLFTTVQIQGLMEMRATLSEAQALRPIVPIIRDVPVPPTDVAEFTKDLTKIYPDLIVKASGSAIQISAKTTANFGQFREAVSHVQNGGSGWRVSVDRLCVGRECPTDKLAVLLKINRVSVDKPQ